ncbi:MAG: M1 family metallopeptidase [Actinomycetota bacterium]|nr:M1 family metallopeptidase [Actinomycetota bacterium]
MSSPGARRRLRPLVVAALCLAVAVPALGPASPAAARVERGDGDSGGGDSLFPQAGNGGYKVRHYDLDLDYAPSSGVLVGQATIAMRATQRLPSFTLDLHRLRVLDIEVAGADATWSRNGDELRVRPADALAPGESRRVVVDYRGNPDTIVDPDGSSEGWFDTDDGAVSVNEPVGAMTWFPVNNTLRDKATYEVSITVPHGKTAVSNGNLVRHETGPGPTTWVWRSPDQLASYLTTVAVGDFDFIRGQAADGTPLLSFVDSGMNGDATSRLRPVMRFLGTQFGPYPFTTSGLIIDNASIGYALEVQNRPVFTSNPGDFLLVHEIAHQWYGNSVTPQDWSDIWLNEGFATYAEWLWEGRTDPGAPQENFDALCTERPSSNLWNPPPADPGSAANLFDRSVYDRGAMALQAMRQRIGGHDFFAVLRGWAEQVRQDNGNTGDLKALAEDVSGRQLDNLFRVWLREPGKPAAC